MHSPLCKTSRGPGAAGEPSGGKYPAAAPSPSSGPQCAPSHQNAVQGVGDRTCLWFQGFRLGALGKFRICRYLLWLHRAACGNSFSLQPWRGDIAISCSTMEWLVFVIDSRLVVPKFPPVSSIPKVVDQPTQTDQLACTPHTCTHCRCMLCPGAGLYPSRPWHSQLPPLRGTSAEALTPGSPGDDFLQSRFVWVSWFCLLSLVAGMMKVWIYMHVSPWQDCVLCSMGTRLADP